MYRRNSRGNECLFDSSAIADANYDANRQILLIKFQGGGAYNYYGVSPQRYRAFCDADSKGRYFVHNIRNNYAFQKLG